MKDFKKHACWLLPVLAVLYLLMMALTNLEAALLEGIVVLLHIGTFLFLLFNKKKAAAACVTVYGLIVILLRCRTIYFFGEFMNISLWLTWALDLCAMVLLLLAVLLEKNRGPLLIAYFAIYAATSVFSIARSSGGYMYSACNIAAEFFMLAIRGVGCFANLKPRLRTAKKSYYPYLEEYKRRMREQNN